MDEIEAGDPGELVERNALAKARAVQRAVTDPSCCVVGSDTTVSLDGDVLGKPADEAEARAFLERLSGRAHGVWSAVAVLAGGQERTAVDCTEVTFRSLSGPEIDWYVATGEWEGRAGGYAIQGRGAALVERIEGDYTCVVGLPVAALVGLLPGLATAP